SLVALGGTARAQVLNGSFESGDFTGWEALGATSVVSASAGVQPTDGTFQASIATGTGAVPAAEIEAFAGLPAGALAAVSDHSATEGSAVRQTVTLGAGESVSLDWNLLTDEPDQGDLDDFVAIVIDGELTLLASVHGASLVSGAGTVFDYQTGYQTYTFEPAQPGT